jgi:hypothetical protein
MLVETKVGLSASVQRTLQIYGASNQTITTQNASFAIAHKHSFVHHSIEQNGTLLTLTYEHVCFALCFQETQLNSNIVIDDIENILYIFTISVTGVLTRLVVNIENWSQSIHNISLDNVLQGYVFDEPIAYVHFQDVDRLIISAKNGSITCVEIQAAVEG